MAQGFKTMVHWNKTVINYPYAITSVVYDPMALDINGDPFGQANAQVSLQCVKDGTRIQLPITQASMSLLPSPQQRALEKEIQLKAGVIEAKNALLAENREEIKELKSKLAMSQRTAEDWRKHSDKQVAEVKRLETVCTSHWEARNDAERKWTETVAELDNARQQLKEVRYANSSLGNELASTRAQFRGYEIGAEHTKSRLQARIQELETTGAAKERDEYSKALVSCTAVVLQQEGEISRLKGKLASETVSVPQQTPATVSLNTRLTAVEARVEKLEEAEGFPIESCQAREGEDIMAYMGGQWVKARKSGKSYYSIRTPEFNKEREWDLANQPTRWKPMPEAHKPDPMAGYYILDKNTPVEEGDEFELSPGVWITSGNWQCCNKSQGKTHRYRRKVK